MNERGGDRRAAGGPPKPPGRSSPKANGLNELGHLGPGPGAGRGRDERARKVANEAGLAALAEEMHRPPGGRSGRRRKGGQHPSPAVGSKRESSSVWPCCWCWSEGVPGMPTTSLMDSSASM